MKKKFIICSVLLSLLLSGCQSSINIFNKNSNKYEKGLQYTNVKSIIKNNSTKAILNVTYLNKLDSKKFDNKLNNFLVGIYILEDSEDTSLQYINNKYYKLTMNGKNYIKIEDLTKKHNLYKNIPLKNPWARYYVISFDKDKQNDLKINYSYKDTTNINIQF